MDALTSSAIAPPRMSWLLSIQIPAISTVSSKATLPRAIVSVFASEDTIVWGVVQQITARNPRQQDEERLFDLHRMQTR